MTDDDARGPLDGLAEAAARAVADSERELNLLDAQVGEVLAAIPGSLARIRTSASDEADPAVDAFEETTERITQQLRNHFAAQRETLGTFNIALFGRTGAGKSTLLSALGELDGERVSQGESDWTTDVEPIAWRGCRLYDTPGINGWGRTKSRRDLEATARRSVQIADIVLLCFDTQSQQASEFQKVADWVRDFGKPVIAVLNVRNARWGLADRVPMEQRAGLSQMVRQHAEHITEELEAIGLFGVPVVAISSRRALAGLASEPYLGPDPQGIIRLQEKYGRGALVNGSNLPVLQSLIAAAVTGGGTQLRTAALREGVRRHLKQLAASLTDLASSAEEPVQALDRSIQGALDVLGYPDQDSPLRTQWLWSEATTGDALANCETARKQPFTSRRKGTYQRHGRHLLRSHLAKERAASLRRAEKLILDAFADRREVSADDFEAGVIDRDAVEAAVGSVWRSAGEFLRRELSAVIDEGLTDVQFLQEEVRIRGAAGEVPGVAGDVLRGVGMFGNAVLAGLTVGAAFNWWNPVGWVALVAGGVLSGLLGWFGRKAKKEAEKQRVRVRATALGGARGAVNSYFDDLEDRTDLAMIRAAWQAHGASLLGMLESAVSLRAVLQELDALSSGALAGANQIPAPPRSEDVIAEALRVVALQYHAGGQPGAAAVVQLFEAWLHEPDRASIHSEEPHPLRELLLEQAETDSDALSTALGGMWSAVMSEAAWRWLDRLQQEAEGEPELAQIHEQAQGTLDRPPRIAVVGDYSAGKTSLIKRLLVEAGRTARPELSVRADPTTEKVAEYPLRRVVLVDTPGFQGGVAEHDQQALESVADAALVVFVLHNNLVIGDTGFIQRVLNGAEDRLGKRERAVFLINRGDGLVGGDPADDPQGFLRARARREEELRRALDALGIPITEDRALTIASDPFGLVADTIGATAADYGAGREWDGIGPLRNAFTAREQDIVRWGRPVAAVEGAATRLMAARTRSVAEAQCFASDMRARQSIINAVQAATQDAETIERSLSAKAERLVQEHTGRILREALGATEHELPAVARRLERWWQDPAFVADLERFNRRTQVQVDDWYATHSSAIGREARSAAYQSGTVRLSRTFDSGRLKERANAARTAGKSVDAAAQAAKALGKRDAFYAVGKRMGVKFKPWGAVKGAQKMAKFGAVLAAVGVVLDGSEWITDRRNADSRERARLEAVAYVRESSEEAVKAILEGTDGSGPIAYLRIFTNWFAQLQEELTAEQEQDQAAASVITTRVGAIDRLLADAEEVLTTNDEEEVDEAA